VAGAGIWTKSGNVGLEVAAQAIVQGFFITKGKWVDPRLRQTSSMDGQTRKIPNKLRTSSKNSGTRHIKGVNRHRVMDGHSDQRCRGEALGKHELEQYSAIGGGGHGKYFNYINETSGGGPKGETENPAKRMWVTRG